MMASNHRPGRYQWVANRHHPGGGARAGAAARSDVPTATGSSAAGPPAWIGDDPDITTPTVARIYDYALGGFHQFEVDRSFTHDATRIWPPFTAASHAHRAFLGRAVHWLLDHGIRQFLDLGSGLPSRGGVPELLQAAAAHTASVHVDLDPLVVAHNRHLLGNGPRMRAIHGDLRQPQAILHHPELAEILDLAQPVALLATGILPFIADRDDPAGIISQLADATVTGSYLVISHTTATAGDTARQELLRRRFDRTPTPMYSRTPEQIGRLLDGWTFVDPGLVPVTAWHPDPADDGPAQAAVLAAVARKPAPHARPTRPGLPHADRLPPTMRGTR